VGVAANDYASSPLHRPASAAQQSAIRFHILFLSNAHFTLQLLNQIRSVDIKGGTGNLSDVLVLAANCDAAVCRISAL